MKGTEREGRVCGMMIHTSYFKTCHQAYVMTEDVHSAATLQWISRRQNCGTMRQRLGSQHDLELGLQLMGRVYITRFYDCFNSTR
jgi:hypothetical protein